MPADAGIQEVTKRPYTYPVPRAARGLGCPVPWTPACAGVTKRSGGEPVQALPSAASRIRRSARTGLKTPQEQNLDMSRAAVAGDWRPSFTRNANFRQ